MIDPANEEARRGLQRAMVLDRVLDLVAQAAELEAAGSLTAGYASTDRATREMSAILIPE